MLTRTTPFRYRLNSRISLDDFKSIYYIGWAHRILGRTIGLAFVLPLGYFALRHRLSRPAHNPSRAPGRTTRARVVSYMVQSGLEPADLAADGAVPRVSQYRLVALVLYAGMFAAAGAVKADLRFAREGSWAGLAMAAPGRCCTMRS